MMMLKKTYILGLIVVGVLGHEIYSVPISYHARAGESSLRPIYDGNRILWMYLQNLRWDPDPAPTKAENAAKILRNKGIEFGERIGPE
jgi:hypothetical protein